MPQSEGAAPGEMLDAIAGASAQEGSIRRRTEGLTWVVWGFVFAGYGVTVALALSHPHGPSPITFAVAIAAWELVGILATVGLWRSAALRVRRDVSPARATAFFVGWWLLFPVAERIARSAAPEDLAMAGTLVAFGVLLAAFALFNPLRYSAMGRRTAGVLAAVAFAGAASMSVMPVAEPLRPAIVAAVIGVSWTCGGMLALFRG